MNHFQKIAYFFQFIEVPHIFRLQCIYIYMHIFMYCNQVISVKKKVLDAVGMLQNVYLLHLNFFITSELR